MKFGLLAAIAAVLYGCGMQKNETRSTASKDLSAEEKALLDGAPKSVIVKLVEKDRNSGSFELKMVGLDQHLTNSDPQYLTTLFDQGKAMPYGIASEQPAGSTTGMGLNNLPQNGYTPGFQPNIGYISDGQVAGQGRSGLLGLGIIPTLRQFIQNFRTRGLFSNLGSIMGSNPIYFNSGNYGNMYQPYGGGIIPQQGGILSGLGSMIFGYNSNGQNYIPQSPIFPRSQGGLGSIFNPGMFPNEPAYAAP